VGNGLRMQIDRLTRSVRRVAGRYGPVARATLVCNRSLTNAFRAPLAVRRPAGRNGATRFSDIGAFEKHHASGHSGWRVANRDGRGARSTHFENTP
jgi:hypothetical protein